LLAIFLAATALIFYFRINLRERKKQEIELPTLLPLYTEHEFPLIPEPIGVEESINKFKETQKFERGLQNIISETKSTDSLDEFIKQLALNKSNGVSHY